MLEYVFLTWFYDVLTFSSAIQKNFDLPVVSQTPGESELAGRWLGSYLASSTVASLVQRALSTFKSLLVRPSASTSSCGMLRMRDIQTRTDEITDMEA